MFLQQCENGNKEERYDHKVKKIREVKNLRRVRKSCMGARDCYRRFMDPWCVCCRIRWNKLECMRVERRNTECFCYLPVSAMNGICSLPMPGWKRSLLSKRTLCQQDRKLGLKPFADTRSMRQKIQQLCTTQQISRWASMCCVLFSQHFWQRKRVYGSKGQIIVVATTTFAHQFPHPRVSYQKRERPVDGLSTMGSYGLSED